MPPDFTAEGKQLREQLEAAALDVHRSLEAWHAHQIAHKTAGLFSELHFVVEALLSGKRNWKSRIRTFLGEERVYEETISTIAAELEPLLTNARIFSQRLRQLRRQHAESLARYSSFLSDLESPSPEPTALVTGELLRMRADGLEFVDAHKQLQLTVDLQLETVLQLGNSMEQLIRMSKALSSNYHAAQRLLTERFDAELRFLRNGFPKRHGA